MRGARARGAESGKWDRRREKGGGPGRSDSQVKSLVPWSPSPCLRVFPGSNQPPNVLRLLKTAPRRLSSWDSGRPLSDHWQLVVHCSLLSTLLLPPLPIRFSWCPHSNSGCCCGLWPRTKPHPFAVPLRILTCYFHSLQISPNPQGYSWSTALD